MPTYWQLLLLILPVFAIIAIGVGLRRLRWVEPEAEASLIKLVVNVCMPCLIFDSVAGNPAFRQAGNVVLPPLIGFVSTAGGIYLALWVGRKLGLAVGAGLRTFALTAGVANYGYLPLPIMAAMWGSESQGLLLVHNVGVEAAVWTVGVLVLSGLSPREGWRKLINPMTITMVVTMVLNFSGLAGEVPVPVYNVMRSLGVCAIPIGLVMIGVTMASYLNEPRSLVDRKVTIGSCALRLALMPVLILAAARWLPVSVEIKRMMVIQAAMPSAVFPIVLSKHYGGQPLTAVQVVLGTTVVGILAIPLWIRLGLGWVGG